jgi:cell division protein FtsA
VGEFLKGETNPKIIGVGEALTLGVRDGYIVDTTLASNSIREAVAMAEKTSGMKIRRAFIAVGGVTLHTDQSAGVAIVSKADGEVTNTDIKNAIQDCENNLNLTNKKVIHVSPSSFRLDGKEVLGRLEGMHGTKLEAKALFITCSIQHFEDLIEAVSMAGIEPIDIIAAPIAGSAIALSEKQKIVGSALVNIGAQTSSLAVFDNGDLVSLQTFSIGSEEITNDIALGLKIPLQNAENLKFGSETESFSKKKLEEIIEARLCDIFESIENHLRKIKRAGLLPAGVIFIGGGANTPGLIQVSKSALNLPSAIGTTEIFGNVKTKLRDPSWFTALGLLVSDTEEGAYPRNSFGGIFKALKITIKSSIKQLMP